MKQKKLRGLGIKKKYKYKSKKKLLYVGTKKQMLDMKNRMGGFLPKKNYLIKKYYSKWGLYRKMK